MDCLASCFIAPSTQRITVSAVAPFELKHRMANLLVMRLS
ncbi:MAG: hypothetical protein ACI9HX_001327, partial [Pseudoalteromonas tetraodonis]